MKDNLKEFIQTHREEFDEPLAPELWASISAGIKPPSHLFINLKKLANMFKYAFGASALIFGTFFIFQSLKQDKVITSVNLSNTPKSENRSPANSSSLNTGSKTESLNESNLKPTHLKKENVHRPREIENTHELPIPETQTAPKPSNYALNGSMISHPAISGAEDSIKTSDSFQMDTLFKGVKHLVVNGNFCEVNISGKNREDVSFKANVNDKAGSVLVFGKTIVKKEEAKIKYSLKDSTLTVWIEMQKLERKERTKISENEESELNFEVPIATNISVKNHSGDIEVQNITSPRMNLESSFGEIEAKEITADLFLKVASGDIHLENINGLIQTNSSFGKQILNRINGNIKINSSSGDITIKQLKGDADVTSSFGFQKFENVSGNINSSASSGDLEIENLTGNLITKTSFGNQDLDNIIGNITAGANSGNIKLEKAIGTLILSTTFGNIRGTGIKLLSNSNFTTSSGDITMEFLNDISELSFDLTSSSGDLQIKKGSVEFNSEKKLAFDKGPIKIKGVSSFGDQLYK